MLAKIAEMKGPDRAIAKRFHEIVQANAPDLSPKTWYGMPAYANEDGKVICFFTACSEVQGAVRHVRLQPLGESDNGNMWPTSWALTKLTPAEEKKIAALVKKAARPRSAPSRDEHGHEDEDAVSGAARRRQPRPDPRAGRAREQPQGRQRRDPEAPADGVHRRLRLGQELAGVRHDRRGVAADDQRDLQRLRAGLHADAVAAGGRPPGWPDDGDHRGPGADGLQPPLHRRHRHRRQRDAAHPLQPAREAAHRPSDRLLVQRPDADGERGDEHREAAARIEKNVVRNVVYQGGMCPRCEGMGSVTDFDLSALYDDSLSLNEGALTIPGYSMDGWYGRIFRGCGFFDADKPIRKYTKKELHDLLHKEPTKIKVDGINLTYEGLIPKIQKSFLSKDVDAMQPHIRAFVERAVTFTTCPECDGTRLSKEARSSKIKGKNIADVCSMQISDLADWLRGLDEPSVAPLLTGLQHLLDSFAEIGLGIPLARPAVGHAVRGRGTAHQDDPPPRLVAHRRHLRLRRADDRPAPTRHRADERPAVAAAGQGQHRSRRGAQARDDRDRRPRRRPRPRRRHGGRHRLLRGHRRGTAGE